MIRDVTRPPEDLIQAVTERRVIPFVGAGFSSPLGLPDWNELLSSLCAELETDLTYEEIRQFANEDFLQIAEYLFLKSDRRIGPIRHHIEKGVLGSSLKPALSTAHVELVNLGAPQIYTTNYDDLLERTFKSLDLSYSVVALPKDVAQISTRDTQIIKYHGDLRHESTLVLTESAYYKRLDFESPMDLKFRSDLLGRSVLYMGYSFRDINIRLIWFKLMQMMQDIPESDRRTSYIVRLGPNPVLDALYRDVGLKTIVLDPRNEYGDEDRKLLLGDFLGNLATYAAGHNDTIAGTNNHPFVSLGFLHRAQNRVKRAEQELNYYVEQGLQIPRSSAAGTVRSLIRRRLPSDLVSEARPVFLTALGAAASIRPGDLDKLIEKIHVFGPDPEILGLVVRLLRGGSEEVHRVRLLLVEDSRVPWEIVWSSRLNAPNANGLVASARRELEWTEAGNADGDLAYLADLLIRVRRGWIFDLGEDGGQFGEQLDDLILRAAKVYPALADYDPDPNRGPDLKDALAQVDERRAAIERGEIERGANDQDHIVFDSLADAELVDELDSDPGE